MPTDVLTPLLNVLTDAQVWQLILVIAPSLVTVRIV
jgi:hypothetical protein